MPDEVQEEIPSQPQTRTSLLRYVPWLLLTIVLATLSGLGLAPSAAPSGPLVEAAVGWADERSCLECHDEAEYFWETGHAQTLRPASDPQSEELLRSFSAASLPAAEGTRIEKRDGTWWAIHSTDHSERQVALSWCFGSGQHARTWTAVLPDVTGATDQLEFRWTWYHDGDQFAVTTGQPPQGMDGFFGKLGVLHDGPRSQRCFSCHTSFLAIERGHLDPTRTRTGVTCQRCHGPRQAHVDSEGAIVTPDRRGTDRADAVNRCAQCHRRAEEMEPGTIRPDNPDIVRFQPVGLVQSACYVKSQMTCTTCHNPHLPFSRQETKGIWQCVQCHDPDRGDGSIGCEAGHRDACIRCHMPTVPMDAPVAFTDHWIRVRERDGQTK